AGRNGAGVVGQVALNEARAGQLAAVKSNGSDYSDRIQVRFAACLCVTARACCRGYLPVAPLFCWHVAAAGCNATGLDKACSILADKAGAVLADKAGSILADKAGSILADKTPAILGN